MNAPALMLPVLATTSAFAVVLSVPRRSPARRIFNDLERRSRGGAVTKVTERVLDERNLGRLRGRFAQAGWYTTTPENFLARCAAFAGMGILAALALAWYLHPATIISIGMVAGFAAGGAHLPFSQLNGAVKRRMREISRALPDLLDTLASTVRAGLALNAALAHAAGAVEGALAHELQGTLSEIRLGRARIDALRALAARVNHEELSVMVRAMVQAERLGANLSSVLRSLSAESRERRVLKAEEIAASLPVKMVLPMAAFMLPALFIMIFGAVAADYYAR